MTSRHPLIDDHFNTLPHSLSELTRRVFIESIRSESKATAEHDIKFQEITSGVKHSAEDREFLVQHRTDEVIDAALIGHDQEELYILMEENRAPGYSELIDAIEDVGDRVEENGLVNQALKVVNDHPFLAGFFGRGLFK